MQVEKTLRKLQHYYENEPQVRALIRGINYRSFNDRYRETNLAVKNLLFFLNDLAFDANFRFQGRGLDLCFEWLVAPLLYNLTDFYGDETYHKPFFILGQNLGLNGLIAELFDLKNEVFDFISTPGDLGKYIYNKQNKDGKSYKELFGDQQADYYYFWCGLIGVQHTRAGYINYQNYLVYLAGYDLFLQKK